MMREEMAPTPARPQRRLIALVLLSCVFVGLIGNFHFVYGRGTPVKKIKKVSWSLSETLINLDEVRGTPLMLVRARYPLFTQAMEHLPDADD